MAAMEPSEFRITTQMKHLATQQAERDGISYSAFVRESIAMRLAWTAALEAVQAGAPPGELTDIQNVTRLLARISQAGGA